MFRLVLPTEARLYAGYLRDLLHDADMLALLAASPEARRRLRPLWRMYTADPLPALLRGPRRPRAGQPSVARRRVAQPRVGKPSLPPTPDRPTPSAAKPAPSVVLARPASAPRAGKPARPDFARMRRGPGWHWPPWLWPSCSARPGMGGTAPADLRLFRYVYDTGGL
jgi:hypothetical protein